MWKMKTRRYDFKLQQLKVLRNNFGIALAIYDTPSQGAAAIARCKTKSQLSFVADKFRKHTALTYPMVAK